MKEFSMGERIRMFKGFRKDMTCNGFQYEEGKTYEMDGDIKLCERGFHACEDPIDCQGYYDPANSVFREVFMEDVSPEKSNDDTKRVARKITIGAEISIPMIGKLHAEYVRERVTESVNKGDSEAVTVGDGKQATAGDSGSATAGDSGSATAGAYGSATAGFRGSATAGDSGSATAGDSGSATAGAYGSATAGFRGSATAGDSGSATAGDSGSATSRGSSSVGMQGLAVAKGNNVKARGKKGSLLIVVEENDDDYGIRSYATGIVDGEDVKEDVWYRCEDGKLVECDEE